MTNLTLEEKINIEARKQWGEMLDCELYLPDYYTQIYAVFGYDESQEEMVNKVVRESEIGFVARRDQVRRLVQWGLTERHTGKYYPDMVAIQAERYLGIK